MLRHDVFGLADLLDVAVYCLGGCDLDPGSDAGSDPKGSDPMLRHDVFGLDDLLDVAVYGLGGCNLDPGSDVGVRSRGI
ncbi:MAG: hypothetical protein OIF51_21020 [Cellvibrionaceae bacterium]|nr:hypothetical protein [Cellvibrionaceae bacterium]